MVPDYTPVRRRHPAATVNDGYCLGRSSRRTALNLNGTVTERTAVSTANKAVPTANKEEGMW